MSREICSMEISGAALRRRRIALLTAGVVASLLLASGHAKAQWKAAAVPAEPDATTAVAVSEPPAILAEQRQAASLKWGAASVPPRGKVATAVAKSVETLPADPPGVQPAAHVETLTPMPQPALTDGGPLPDVSDFAVDPRGPRRAVLPRAHRPGSATGLGIPDGPCDGSPAGDGYEYWGDPIFGIPSGALRRAVHDRLWFDVDALVWWTKGAAVPPLLTTGAENSFGVPTEPLVGGQTLNRDARAGGRMTLGLWLNSCDTAALEFSYLGLEKATQGFHFVGDGTRTLARPIFDLDQLFNQNTGVAGAPNGLAIDSAGGTFTVVSTSEFHVFEILLRRSLVQDCNYRIDALTGYRFQRLDDNLRIDDREPVDNTFDHGFDEFDTRNDFQGGVLGMATQWHGCRWSLGTTMKVGLGSTISRVQIKGQTISTATGPDGVPGGVLALPSNMGEYHSSRFAMIPELGINAGYDLTRRLRLNFGYTLLFWSGVARPGDQIDTNVNSLQIPLGDTAMRPQFRLRTSDFWAQGVNLGLDYHF